MEIIDSNSDEFYRQKYLKYKKKYIEAQQLYEEDLEGGADTWTYYFSPQDLYENLKGLFDNYKALLPAFELRLGPNAYYTTIKDKELKNCQTDFANQTIKWDDGLGNKNVTTAENVTTGFLWNKKVTGTTDVEKMTYMEEEIANQIKQKETELNKLVKGDVRIFRIKKDFIVTKLSNVKTIEWLGTVDEAVAKKK